MNSYSLARSGTPPPILGIYTSYTTERDFYIYLLLARIRFSIVKTAKAGKRDSEMRGRIVTTAGEPVIILALLAEPFLPEFEH